MSLVEQAHSKLEALAGSDYGKKFPQLQKLTEALKGGSASAATTEGAAAVAIAGPVLGHTGHCCMFPAALPVPPLANCCQTSHSAT